MSTETAHVATVERQGWTVETALDHVLALLASADKRYEQRFEASQKIPLFAQTEAPPTYTFLEWTPGKYRFEVLVKSAGDPTGYVAAPAHL